MIILVGSVGIVLGSCEDEANDVFDSFPSRPRSSRRNGYVAASFSKPFGRRVKRVPRHAIVVLCTFCARVFR